MDKNDFLVLRHYFNNDKPTIRETSEATGLSLGLVHSIKNNLVKNNYVSDESKITEKGIKELEKYRVKSAIILAAGLSTRFAPLSFDTPKGLLKVNGEILIERQIQQLKEVGINNIVLVLGYKKESFFYLGEKYNVKILINPYYDTKNNSYSAYLARDYFQNAYLCSSDSYFLNNPFNTFEFESFAITEDVKEKRDGSFLKLGSKDKIVSREKGNRTGLVYKGTMYWNNEFGSSLRNLLEEHNETGDLYQESIYGVIFDHLHQLPPFYSSERKNGGIFKFFSLKELIKFDEKYIEHT